jgi:predicted phage-related endonuclease
MEIHDIQQGTPEWDAFRLTHFGASEAAAMLGLSKKVKRTELLRMKHTGIAKEFSDWVQENVLDHGHEVEALARPIIERIIGAKLYPVVCSEGKLSASCDGLTADDRTAFEHKQWNADLAELVRNGIVPDDHMSQCQQILMITEAERVIFTVSDGTEEKMVYVEVRPDQEWFSRIMHGWTQFAIDLENYRHVEIQEKPKAEAIMDLPALSVQASGMVTYSNLPEFKAAAESYISGINTDLQTDNDFANAEATVKFCKKTEETLDVTKKAILAQTASIDEVIRTVEHIQAQLRDKRLLLDKLVKTEKDKRKTEMVAAANVKYAEHVAALQAEITGINLNPLLKTPDFGGAIKGLKSLASMHDALDAALANGKIEADRIALDVRAKLVWFGKYADDYRALFADMQLLMGLTGDAFEAIVKNRIAEHKAAEAAAKLAEEEARIRAEEWAKAKAELDAAKNSQEGAQLSPAAQELYEAEGAARFSEKHPALASKPEAAKAPRPTRMALIECIASHYGVSILTAGEWLRTVFTDGIPTC